MVSFGVIKLELCQALSCALQISGAIDPKLSDGNANCKYVGHESHAIPCSTLLKRSILIGALSQSHSNKETIKVIRIVTALFLFFPALPTF